MSLYYKVRKKLIRFFNFTSRLDLVDAKNLLFKKRQKRLYVNGIRSIKSVKINRNNRTSVVVSTRLSPKNGKVS